MATRLLRIHVVVDSYSPPNLGERWINTDDVHEILPTKYTVDDVEHDGSLIEREPGPNPHNLTVSELPADLVAAVNGFTDDTPTRLVLTDRGTWQSGVYYKPLDVAEKPGTDPAERYLCVQANESTSVAVLSNESFWCRLA